MVGARMMWFTEEQAQNFLHINDAGSFTLVSTDSGPWFMGPLLWEATWLI